MIDVDEYLDSAESDLQEIAYYQLKHTTVRKKQLFRLSDLKDTITGFARRYTEFLKKTDETRKTALVTFSIVTNRAIAENFKRNIAKVSSGGKANSNFQATLEIKPEKAIKLEKDALAQIETITADNARLVSNLHANLGGLYRMNGHPDLAREHMEKSISLLDQFN